MTRPTGADRSREGLQPAHPADRRGPLGEQVAADLLEQIVTAQFRPGEPLPTERELAERHNVSRLTLREAIGILRQKGIIEVRRGRGTFVRPTTEWSPLDPLVLGAQAGHAPGHRASMENLLEARRIVEVGVAELAAVRRRPSDLQSLAAALQLMRDAGDEVDRFVGGDLDFHGALLHAARNPVIGALFAPVRALLQEDRRRTSAVAADRAGAIRCHQAIFDAVEAAEGAAAGQAMAEHLRQTEVALRRMRGRPTRTRTD
jgi:DNA-binding FadR family transcriptional regulator